MRLRGLLSLQPHSLDRRCYISIGKESPRACFGTLTFPRSDIGQQRLLTFALSHPRASTWHEVQSRHFHVEQNGRPGSRNTPCASPARYISHYTVVPSASTAFGWTTTTLRDTSSPSLLSSGTASSPAHVGPVRALIYLSLRASTAIVVKMMRSNPAITAAARLPGVT